jgi:hypothetical protein
MGICQIIYVAMLFMGLGVSLKEHGEPKRGTNNAWYSIIGVIIQLVLLSFGGFFG